MNFAPLHEEDEGEADRRQAEQEQDREIVEADWLKRRYWRGQKIPGAEGAPRQLTMMIDACGWRRWRTIMPAKGRASSASTGACPSRTPGA